MPFDELVGRILAQVLKLGTETREVHLEEVTRVCGASRPYVEELLEREVGTSLGSSFHLTTSDRVRLAVLAAENGALREASQALTWQEFETFAQQCILRGGFEVDKNVRIQTRAGTLQIDLVGIKGPMIISFDCKHWRPPLHISRFKTAAEHQRTATRHLLATRKVARQESLFGLPVILTIHDPPTSLSFGVVLLSVQKMADFLNQVTPFSPGLPFIEVSGGPRESPIKQADERVLG